MATETAPTPTAPAQTETAPTPNPEGNFFESIMSKINAPDEPPPVEPKKEEPKTTEPPKDKPPEQAKVKTAAELLSEEPKKEEEKTPEPEVDETKGMTENAGRRFKEIKAQVKTAQSQATEFKTKYEQANSQLAEMQAKIKEFETAGTQLANLAAREQEWATKEQEYERELSLARVEGTAEFKRTVLEPMAKVISVVDRIAKKYEMPKERILAALEEPDYDARGEKIDALASEFKEFDRNSLYTLGHDYAKLSERRDELRNNSVEARKQIEEREQQEAEQSAAESKKTWLRATGEIWEKAKNFVPDLPDDVAKEIQGIVAGTDFDKETPRGKVIAATSAAILPHLVQRIQTRDAKIAELEAKVAAYQNAKPGAGSGTGADINEKREDVSTGGFLENVLPKLGR